MKADRVVIKYEDTLDAVLDFDNFSKEYATITQYFSNKIHINMKKSHFEYPND